jgi:hypothetical protein
MCDLLEGFHTSSLDGSAQCKVIRPRAHTNSRIPLSNKLASKLDLVLVSLISPGQENRFLVFCQSSWLGLVSTDGRTPGATS